MKWKIALLAGLATLSIAASGMTPAHAVVTGNWTLLDDSGQAQTYACRVPGVGGTTVRFLLDGLGSEAKAGMGVYKVNKTSNKLMSWLNFSLLLEQSTAQGELFVPDDRRYTVNASLGSDDPFGYWNSQWVNVPDLVLC